MRIDFGEMREPTWREALARDLSTLGARQLWRAQSGDVFLGWYRVGWRLVRVEWDVWTGLSLVGSRRLVSTLAGAVRRHTVTSNSPTGG